MERNASVQQDGNDIDAFDYVELSRDGIGTSSDEDDYLRSDEDLPDLRNSNVERSTFKSHQECSCTYDYSNGFVKARLGYRVLKKGDSITRGETVSFECRYVSTVLTWENGLRFYGRANMTCNTCEKWQKQHLPSCRSAQQFDVVLGQEDDLAVLPGGTVQLETGQSRRFSCSNIWRQPEWVYRGKDGISVKKAEESGERESIFVSYLDITDAEDKHSGIYECFSRTPAGHQTLSTFLHIEVVRKSELDGTSSSTTPKTGIPPIESRTSTPREIPDDKNIHECFCSYVSENNRHLAYVGDKVLEKGGMIRLRETVAFYCRHGLFGKGGLPLAQKTCSRCGLWIGNKDLPACYLPPRSRSLPSARVEPERQIITQGTSGELRCIVSGIPKPTVTWSKVGADLSDRHKVQDDNLYISDVTIEDRGLYVCRAESRDGTAQASAIVEVERREVPAIELYPEATQTVIRGGSALFQCRVTARIPTPTVEWIRADGSPFTSSTEIVNGGVIRFNRVTGDEEGTYICTAENSGGRVTAQAVLQIQGAPTVRIIQANPYRVRPGETIRFECLAEGDPQPNVLWRKLRRPLVSYASSESVEDGRALLEIRRVSQSDSGFYICSARNSAGVTEERIQLIVEDSDSTVPEVMVEDRVTTTSWNSSVELRCFITGTDRDIYLKWTRSDGRPLPVNHRLQDGVLYIQNVQPEDAGEYSCLGTVEGDIILFTTRTRLAVVAPPRIQLNPPLQTVRPGDVVRIHCIVTGDQPISVDWSRIGGNLAPYMVQSGEYLIINGITANDAGRYLCTAVNAAGKAEGVIEIVVNEIDGTTSSTSPEAGVSPTESTTSTTTWEIPDDGNNRECSCEYDFGDTRVNAYMGHKRLQMGDTIRRGDTVSFLCGRRHVLSWENGLRYQGKAHMTCSKCEIWIDTDLPTCRLLSLRRYTLISSDKELTFLPGGILQMREGESHNISCVSARSEPQWKYETKENVAEWISNPAPHHYRSNLEIKHVKFDNKGKYECITATGESVVLNLEVDGESIGPANCSKFPDQPGLRAIYSGFSVGSVARFRCSPPSRNLSGRSSRSVCLEGGTWSNPAPMCEGSTALNCSKFPYHQGLRVSYSGFSIGSTARFRCFPSSREMSGSSNSTCLQGGTWSNPAPMCDAPKCSIDDLIISLPKDVTLDKLNVINEFSPGSEVQLRCENFLMDGDSKALCGEHGRWKVGNLKCIPGCRLDVNPSSKLSVEPRKDNYRFGEFISLSCPLSYQLSNEVERLMCLSNSWSEDLPECIPEID